jgi:predicted nucleic acid-binding protein
LIGDRYEEGVLVDTCIWIEFFRKNTAAAQALTDLIEAGRAVIAGVVMYELTQGVRSDKERTTIRNLLAGLDYVEMSPDLWGAAGGLGRAFKRKGHNIPMSDLLLGAIAIKHNLSLFTTDTHFDTIPGLKRYMPG